MNLDRALKAAAEHYTHERFVDALRIYERLLQKHPDHPDALNDAGLCHYQLDAPQEAIACFEQALEHDPSYEGAFFNLLEVTLDTEDRQQAATRFETFGTAIPQSPEKERFEKQIHASHPRHRGDGAPASSHSTDALRVAFVCGPDRKFITDIEREIGKRHEVRTVYFDDSIDLQQIQRVMDWADVTWFEWCDQILVHASQKLRKTSRVVCRLHSYEALSNLPMQVNWDFVDQLVLVALHMEAIFKDRFSKIAATVPIDIIHNGVDLDRFPFNERSPGHDIAYVGYLNHKKNPSLLLQCLHALVQQDDRYHLHVAGIHQDPRYEIYWDHMLGALDLHDHVTVNGWVDNVSSWLDDKQYLVSTSVHESFGHGIAEAMARGIKPVIHHFKGASELFPGELLFTNIPEMVDLITEASYDSKSYREHIRSRYALENQINKVDTLLKDSSTPPISEVLSRKEVGDYNKNSGQKEEASPSSSADDRTFAPPIIRTSQTKKHLFIIGQPRSGTTITWKTIRQDPRWRCYNEPFNQHLRKYVEADRDSRKRTVTEYLDIPHLVTEHWSPILPAQELIARFHDQQEKYLQELCATSEHTSIDFTHINARVEHLREIFPDALLVHLVRDPRAWVTSHLRPYGKWLPGMPDQFFHYEGDFNYWSRQAVAGKLKLEGFAHEQLLQVWDHFTREAEMAEPDITLPFETFSLDPEATLRTLYECVDFSWRPFDFSNIRAPNPPFRPDAQEWKKAVREQLSEVGRRFLHDYTASSSAQTPSSSKGGWRTHSANKSPHSKLHKPDRTVLITGIPRSGTSLFSTLVNKLANAVSLNEILYNIDDLPGQVAEIRKRLLKGEPIPNKYDSKSNLTTNTQEDVHVESRVVCKSFNSDVLVASKVNVPYLAHLDQLLEYGFKVVAIVRDPLFTIGSWCSDKSAEIPEAQVSDNNMHPRWRNFDFTTTDPIGRQAEIWNQLAKLIARYQQQIKIYTYEQVTERTSAVLQDFCAFAGLSLPETELDGIRNMNDPSRYENLDAIRRAIRIHAPMSSKLGYTYDDAGGSGHKPSISSIATVEVRNGRDQHFEKILKNRSVGVVSDFSSSSDALLVAFGGIVGEMAIPAFEFFNLTSGLPCNKIYIRDLEQAWYQMGLPKLGTSIDDIADRLRALIDKNDVHHVVMVGNSMGGYAALLFGHLVGADEVHAFSPQSVIDPEKRSAIGDERWDLQLSRVYDSDTAEPKHFDLLPTLRTESIANTTYHVYYSKQDKLDVEHATRLSGLPNLRIHSYVTGGHSLVRHLRDVGVLTEILTGSLKIR